MVTGKTTIKLSRLCSTDVIILCQLGFFQKTVDQIIDVDSVKYFSQNGLQALA